jgi:hypothetical protein
MNKQNKNKTLQIRNSTAEFLTFAYQSKGDGVEVRVQNGTIWLSQKNMGLLFDTSTDNIGLHLKNIFNDNELSEFSVTEIFSATASDGKNYQVKHRCACQTTRRIRLRHCYTTKWIQTSWKPVSFLSFCLYVNIFS